MDYFKWDATATNKDGHEDCDTGCSQSHTFQWEENDDGSFSPIGLDREPTAPITLEEQMHDPELKMTIEVLKASQLDPHCLTCALLCQPTQLRRWLLSIHSSVWQTAYYPCCAGEPRAVARWHTCGEDNQGSSCDPNSGTSLNERHQRV